ncbi:MAG: GNAT family N-acetyltransferase [Bacteroidota bacterium]
MHQRIPTITTERLLLREIEDSDLENIFKGLSNPRVFEHYGVQFHSLEATKEQMAWYADPKQHWWAICGHQDGEFYGAGGLNDIDLNEGKAEIGLWLLPDHWGKGIMTEVLPLIADHGLNFLNLKRIEGFVETDNLNCKRAMSKLDFQHERTITDFEVKNGKNIHVDVYAKTTNE